MYQRTLKHAGGKVDWADKAINLLAEILSWIGMPVFLIIDVLSGWISKTKKS